MTYVFETSGCTILSHKIKSIILRVFFFFTFRAQSYDRKYFLYIIALFSVLSSCVNFKHEKFLCHEIHFKLYSNTLTCHNVVDKNRIFSSWEIENDFQFWKIYSLVFIQVHSYHMLTFSKNLYKYTSTQIFFISSEIYTDIV